MEPQPRLLHTNSEIRKTLTYRVRGIPLSVNIEALRKGLEVLLETQDVRVDSLAPNSIGRHGQVATIRIANSAKLPDIIRNGLRVAAGQDERMLTLDTHFHGFTPLYSPAGDIEHSLE